MLMFNEKAFDALRKRVESNSFWTRGNPDVLFENINNAMSDLNMIKNESINYIYWKVKGVEEDADDALARVKCALARRGELNQLDHLICEEDDEW